jgi:hypothetical protein
MRRRGEVALRCHSDIALAFPALTGARNNKTPDSLKWRVRGFVRRPGDEPATVEAGESPVVLWLVTVLFSATPYVPSADRPLG